MLYRAMSMLVVDLWLYHMFLSCLSGNMGLHFVLFVAAKCCQSTKKPFMHKNKAFASPFDLKNYRE